MLSMMTSGRAIQASTCSPVSGLVPSSSGTGRLSGERYSAATPTAAWRVEDKRIINAQADVKSAVPFKYRMGVEKYCRLRQSLECPQEINMSRVSPVERRERLTGDERRVSSAIWGFFRHGRFTRGEQTSFSAPIAHHRAGMPAIPLAAGVREPSIPRVPVHCRELAA